LARRMSLGHVDLAIRGDEDIVRLEEVVGLSRSARFPEGHQELAVGSEFVDLVSHGRGLWRSRRWGSTAPGGIRTASPTAAAAAPAAARASAVRHPDVAVSIYEDTVRRDQHPRAKALHQRSRRVELENRIEIRAGTAIRAATLGDPD